MVKRREMYWIDPTDGTPYPWGKSAIDEAREREHGAYQVFEESLANDDDELIIQAHQDYVRARGAFLEEEQAERDRIYQMNREPHQKRTRWDPQASRWVLT